MSILRRLVGLLGAAALAVTACGSGTSPAPVTIRTAADDTSSTSSSPAPTGSASRSTPVLHAGRSAWVAVSVATLWRSPESPRPVDAPALTRPARIEAWLAGMTTDERRALNGRADTQALLGDRVRVLRLQRHWAKVVVPTQPTPLDARGYPGWVPRRQLTARAPVRTTQVATVTRRTAWLRTDDAAATEALHISFGTRLPVAGTTASAVRVHLPTGAVRRIDPADVVVRAPGEPAFAPTRASLVRHARSFVGLDYLWAGASGFGLDCSGLTWLTYRVHGVRIPRDASAQATAGTAVGRPRRGDLLFFGDPVHHVAMFAGRYAGRGRMVHAPGTGRSVEVIPTATPAWAAEYVGARRLLP